MAPSARDNYLTTETMTATPQKLQLLLIEAALCSARRAGRQWRDQQDQQALESLIHAQAVISELLRGVEQQSHSELTDRVAADLRLHLPPAGGGRLPAGQGAACRCHSPAGNRAPDLASGYVEQRVVPQRVDQADDVPAPTPGRRPRRPPRTTWSRFRRAACRSRREPPRRGPPATAPSDRPAAAGSPYLHLRKVLNAALRRQPYPSRPTEPTPSKASVEGSGVGVGVYVIRHGAGEGRIGDLAGVGVSTGVGELRFREGGGG